MNAAPSVEHAKLAVSASGDENANVIALEVVVPPGATAAPLPSVTVVIVTVGAVWSTVHVNDTSGPVLPDVSTALTKNECEPSFNARYSIGLMHVTNELSSIKHSK